MAYRSFKSARIKDKVKKKRKGEVEIFNKYYNTSDGLTLKLLQNDPWDTNFVVIGVPTFLSTNSEFVDLSIMFEEEGVKFLSPNLRNHELENREEKPMMGTVVADMIEFIDKVETIYSNKSVFLLGQGFGANLAGYLFQKGNKNIKGMIVANPLKSTLGINFFKLDFLKYQVFVASLKSHNLLPKKSLIQNMIRKLTNNETYKKEILELWERKYINGVPFYYVSKAKHIIENFWVGGRREGLLLDIVTTHNCFLESKFDEEDPDKFEQGNHLVFTDYLNEDVIKGIVEKINEKLIEEVNKD